jgi:hypothetical protein
MEKSVPGVILASDRDLQRTQFAPPVRASHPVIRPDNRPLCLASVAEQHGRYAIYSWRVRSAKPISLSILNSGVSIVHL